MRVKFIADDGTEFTDERLCRAYEHLIAASKDSEFGKLVRGLFAGATSWSYSNDPNDVSEEIFCPTNSKHMQQFIANLVAVLPKLHGQLQQVVNQVTGTHP